MNDLWDLINDKLDENKSVNVKELRKIIKVKKYLDDNEFVSNLKKSLKGVVKVGVVEDIKNWKIINESELDLSLGEGKKIKIYVNHGEFGERIIRKNEKIRDYWLVVCGGVSKKNELGYCLKGCSGDDIGDFEKEKVKGKNNYKVVDFGRMRNINLVRRIVLGC